MQEVQGATARAGMESTYQREETSRMRNLIQDLRGKLTDLESKVRLSHSGISSLHHAVLSRI